MLVLGNQNALGNVLHVVVGPESDLHQDIHGAKILDITPILAHMSGDNKVYLSLTRCRSEGITSRIMTEAKIPYINSFTGTNAPSASQPAVEAKQEQAVQTGAKCQYCGNEAALLPIEGFKVCGSCAAIELGRRLKIRK